MKTDEDIQTQHFEKISQKIKAKLMAEMSPKNNLAASFVAVFYDQIEVLEFLRKDKLNCHSKITVVRFHVTVSFLSSKVITVDIG